MVFFFVRLAGENTEVANLIGETVAAVLALPEKWLTINHFSAALLAAQIRTLIVMDFCHLMIDRANWIWNSRDDLICILQRLTRARMLEILERTHGSLKLSHLCQSVSQAFLSCPMQLACGHHYLARRAFSHSKQTLSGLVLLDLVLLHLHPALALYLKFPAGMSHMLHVVLVPDLCLAPSAFLVSSHRAP